MKGSKELLPYVKLRFNIDNPTLEECYAYGYECSQKNIEEEDNPYNEGTKEYDYWTEGWWAGFYGVEPEFEIEDSHKQDKQLQKNKLFKEAPKMEDKDKNAKSSAQPPVNSNSPSSSGFNPYSYRLMTTWVNNSLAKTLKITGAVAAAMIIVFQLLPFGD